MSVDGWVEALATECRKHWDSTGKVFLLSGVPGVLRIAGYKVEDILQGRKLKDVLFQEGTDAVKVVQNEASHLIWGLAPTDVTLEPPHSQYFPPHRERPATSLPNIRFKPAFWKAFAAPLEEDNRRYLLAGPWVRFQDLPKIVDAPAGSTAIEREYTADASPVSSEEGVNSTLTRISQWMKAHDADPSQYAVGKVAGKLGGVARAEESALHDFLAMLTPSELHRLSLPLDIVARLLKMKVHQKQ